MCRLASRGLVTDVEVYDRLARACEAFLEQSARARWSGVGPPAARDARRALAPLERALAAYHGDLLPELPDAPWAEAERERLRDRHHRLLMGLGAIALSLGEPARAVEVTRRVLADVWRRCVADPAQIEACRAGRAAADLRLGYLDAMLAEPPDGAGG